MVVGRTLWDLVWEMIQNPRLRTSFLAMLILLEVALIILALLIHSGLLVMKFSLGGFDVEVPQRSAALTAFWLKHIYVSRLTYISIYMSKESVSCLLERDIAQMSLKNI